jgi:C-terminal processing protease CtpA/Prc
MERKIEIFYIYGMLYIVLFFSLMFIACGEVSEPERSEHEQELLDNYQLLKAYFYHPERIKEFYEYRGLNEVDSMYSSLNDYLKGARYTKYYPPDTSEEVFENIVNSERYYSFGFERGLHIDTVIVDDEEIVRYTLVVTDVYPYSPANSAGLKKYDRLLSANGEPLTGITDTNIIKIYLRSDTLFQDTTVFEVLRGTETRILSAMIKEEVPQPTVYLDSIIGIPYMYITRFTRKTNNPDGTYREFKEYLNEIRGAKTAIIDLRHNGGGDIEHCTAMAAELVPLNNELVYDVVHQNRNGKNVIDTVHYFAKNYLYLMGGEGAGIGTKWIILMSEWSASCSERFIAAVKHNRPETVLIGENSYGKGIGQVFGFTPAGGLAYITSLQSYYPDGRTFHLDGIPPEIPVPLNSPSATYIAAIQEAAWRLGEPGIALAKRSFAPAQLENLPPMRKSEKPDLGMHYLLHEWK